MVGQWNGWTAVFPGGQLMGLGWLHWELKEAGWERTEILEGGWGQGELKEVGWEGAGTREGGWEMQGCQALAFPPSFFLFLDWLVGNEVGDCLFQSGCQIAHFLLGQWCREVVNQVALGAPVTGACQVELATRDSVWRAFGLKLSAHQSFQG